MRLLDTIWFGLLGFAEQEREGDKNSGTTTNAESSWCSNRPYERATEETANEQERSSKKFMISAWNLSVQFEETGVRSEFNPNGGKDD